MTHSRNIFFSCVNHSFTMQVFVMCLQLSNFTYEFLFTVFCFVFFRWKGPQKLDHIFFFSSAHWVGSSIQNQTMKHWLGLFFSQIWPVKCFVECLFTTYPGRCTSRWTNQQRMNTMENVFLQTNGPFGSGMIWLVSVPRAAELQLSA